MPLPRLFFLPTATLQLGFLFIVQSPVVTYLYITHQARSSQRRRLSLSLSLLSPPASGLRPVSLSARFLDLEGEDVCAFEHQLLSQRTESNKLIDPEEEREKGKEIYDEET